LGGRIRSGQGDGVARIHQRELRINHPADICRSEECTLFNAPLGEITSLGDRLPDQGAEQGGLSHARFIGESISDALVQEVDLLLRHEPVRDWYKLMEFQVISTRAETQNLVAFRGEVGFFARLIGVEIVQETLAKGRVKTGAVEVFGFILFA